MEQSAKMVSHHLNTIMGHFKVPSLMKNLNQATTSNNNSSESNNVKNNIKKLSNADQLDERVSESLSNHKSENHCIENMQSIKRHSCTRIEVNHVKENHVCEKSQNELNATKLSGRPNDMRKQSFVIKPIKLKNVTTKVETYDTLYTRGTEVSMIVSNPLFRQRI